MPRIIPFTAAAALLLLGMGCRTIAPAPTASSRTSYLTCEDSTGRSGYRLARSNVLISPDGTRRARAEVEALPLQNEIRDSLACQNISRILVSTPGTGERQVFAQNPGGEGKNGNGVKLIDWSPDGQRLLFALYTWLYPNQVDPPLAVVYNASSGTVDAIEVASLLRRRIAGDCSLQIEIAGFTPDGRIVVRSAPGVRSGQEEPCRVAPTLWLVHDAEKSIEALPATSTIERYGRWTADDFGTRN